MPSLLQTADIVFISYNINHIMQNLLLSFKTFNCSIKLEKLSIYSLHSANKFFSAWFQLSFSVSSSLILCFSCLQQSSFPKHSRCFHGFTYCFGLQCCNCALPPCVPFLYLFECLVNHPGPNKGPCSPFGSLSKQK